MTGKIFKFLLLGFVLYVGYVYFKAYRESSQMPDMPEGAYSITFLDDEFRGIVSDVQVTRDWFSGGFKSQRRLNWANPDRQYLGVPFDVPDWMKNAWATCVPPTSEELAGYTEQMPEDLRSDLQFSRLDAVCRLEVEGEEIIRGLIFSVPKL